MSLPTFTLTIRGHAPAPPMPDVDDPAVTAWRDARGNLGAVSHRVGAERWLHVPHVGSFRIDLEAGTVEAVPAAGAAPEALQDEFRRTAVPVALQLAGWEVLHASAVRTERGVVALCAASETGKSTLAHGLELRGHPLWADDAVVLRVAPSATTAHALPFDLRLRPASARHFGYAVGGGVGGGVGAGEDARQRARTAPATDHGEAPLCAIFLLERLGSEHVGSERLGSEREGAAASRTPHGVEFLPLEGAEALRGLLEHAIFFGLDDPVRKRRMMRNYLRLVAEVGVVRLRFPSGLASLPHVLDALEERLR